MQRSVAVFRSDHHAYYADTCEPFKDAAARGEIHLAACARGAYPGHPLPAHALLEVRTVGYWDADHHQSWGLNWHYNEGIELTYLARGKLHFAVDDQEFHLKRGDLTITRPWQRHRVGDPDVSACRLYWLILDVGVRRPNQPWRWPGWLASSASDIGALTAMLSHNEQPVWEADAEVAHYFQKLGEVADGYADGSGESYLRLYIGGLIVALTEVLRRHRPVLNTALSSTQRTVELFLASLAGNCAEEWDVDGMAAQCGLGRSRFAYYCRELTNMSPGEYLTRCRIQAGARLLSGTAGLSVTDVASRCGFGSSQYFATVFRRHIGCSPGDYRAQQAGMSTGH